MQCHDELSCLNINDYIKRKPFLQSGFGFISFGYLILFSAYWIWRCISAFQIINQAIEMEKFYRLKYFFIA
jgi:hypothetical protein